MSLIGKHLNSIDYRAGKEIRKEKKKKGKKKKEREGQKRKRKKINKNRKKEEKLLTRFVNLALCKE